jgi:hypothetical protein
MLKMAPVTTIMMAVETSNSSNEKPRSDERR